MKKNAIIKTAAATILCAMLFSCGNANSAKIKQDKQFQKELETLLQASNASDENLRYAIINKISAKWLADQKYDDLILYLTDHVERNPNDKYNAYWLLMTAYAYVQLRQERVAEYYFERIIKNYPDLRVKDQSVHFLCLERLIQISTNHENRIQYFNTLINRFPSNVSITEMYVRLAREYEPEFRIQAVEIMNRAVAHHPDKRGALDQLIAALQKTGNSKLANAWSEYRKDLRP